jgi:hypothetical protein
VQPESAVAVVHVFAQPAAVTLSTFQLARFWLNVEADWKAAFMFDTDAVFHEPRGWLKAVAPLNREAMFETDATFHLPMSALNVGWL